MQIGDPALDRLYHEVEDYRVMAQNWRDWLEGRC